jgi:hypothetical protein
MRLAHKHFIAGGPVLADCPKQDVRNLLKFGFSGSFGDGSLYSARYCSIWGTGALQALEFGVPEQFRTKSARLRFPAANYDASARSQSCFSVSHTSDTARSG